MSSSSLTTQASSQRITSMRAYAGARPNRSPTAATARSASAAPLRVQRHGDGAAAVLLVHPHLVAAGPLVDLGGGPAAEDEDRGLAHRAHRLDQRLHHPRAAAASSGSSARTRRPRRPRPRWPRPAA